METKRKHFTAIVLCLVLLVLSLTCVQCIANVNIANAQTIGEEDEAVPYGVYTDISVSIGVKDGNVVAKAKNKFTLGTSKVQVYVELYSSTTYQDSCDNMTFAGSNYIDDLNIYKSIEILSSTNGEQKYWRAKVRYKLDNKEWQSLETRTILVSADGKILN